MLTTRQAYASDSSFTFEEICMIYSEIWSLLERQAKEECKRSQYKVYPGETFYAVRKKKPFKRRRP